MVGPWADHAAFSYPGRVRNRPEFYRLGWSRLAGEVKHFKWIRVVMLPKIGSAARNVFEGKKGEYLCGAQTRIVNITGVFCPGTG